RQHVVYEPLPLLLTNHRLANHSILLQQVVRRLQNSLEMRRITLCQWKLFAESIQPNSPCKHVSSPRDFDQPVESATYGRWQRQIPCQIQRDDMTGRNVLPHERRDDDPRLARLG